MTDPAPADHAAERRLLGSVLLMPSLVDQWIGSLTADQFDYKLHGLLWGSISDLVIDNQPIKVDTLARRFVQNGGDLADIGGTAGLADLMSGVDSGEADYWRSRVMEMHRRRRLLSAGRTAERLAQNDSADLDASYAKVQEMLLAGLSASPEGTVDANAGVDAVIDRLRQYLDDPDKITGLEIGWPALDIELDGLQPGAVTTVYGLTGMFKSTFVMNIAHALARQGIPGLVFTTEMMAAQVFEMIIGFETGVNFRWARRAHVLGQYRKDIEDASECVRDFPLWVNDRSPLDISFIQGVVTRMKKTRHIQYVIVDLVDKVGTSRYRDSKTESQSFIMESMKSLAKAANVPVVLTSHVRKTDWQLKQQRKAYLPAEEMIGSGGKSADSDNTLGLMLVTPDENSGGWRAMDRDEIIEASRLNGELDMMVAITKNRFGDQANLPFKVSLRNGRTVYPV